MTKTILLTGATDGIGLETAKALAATGHTLLIHGRSADKLAATQAILENVNGVGKIESYRANLSDMAAVTALAEDIANNHTAIDVIINNAGVFKAPNPVTASGHDLRFMVNTIAPYVLTQKLLPLIPNEGRILNLSSAAQAPVELAALRGEQRLNDNAAYAQSKLAITMWSAHLAQSLGRDGPVVAAINPGSFLGSKMVKEAYGMEGKDIHIGSDILVRAALSDEFADATGQYFDNDSGRFADPHPDALDAGKNAVLVDAIDGIVNGLRS